MPVCVCITDSVIRSVSLWWVYSPTAAATHMTLWVGVIALVLMVKMVIPHGFRHRFWLNWDRSGSGQSPVAFQGFRNTVRFKLILS